MLELEFEIELKEKLWGGFYYIKAGKKSRPL